MWHFEERSWKRMPGLSERERFVWKAVELGFLMVPREEPNWVAAQLRKRNKPRLSILHLEKICPKSESMACSTDNWSREEGTVFPPTGWVLV